MRIPLFYRAAAHERRYDSEYTPRQRRENALKVEMIKRNATGDDADNETAPASSAEPDQFTSSIIPAVSTPLSQVQSSAPPIVDPAASTSAPVISTVEATTAEAQSTASASAIPSSTPDVPPLDAVSSAPPPSPAASALSSLVPPPSTTPSSALVVPPAAAPTAAVSSEDPPATSQIADPAASAPQQTTAASTAATDTTSVPLPAPAAPAAPAVGTTATDVTSAASTADAGGSSAVASAQSALPTSLAIAATAQSSSPVSQATISGGSSALATNGATSGETASATTDLNGVTAAANATASAVKSEKSGSAATTKSSKDAHETPLKLSKPSPSLLGSLSIPASSTFATSISAIPVFDSLPTAPANSGDGSTGGPSGNVNPGVDVDGNSNGGNGITTTAKSNAPKTTVIVTGVVIGVSVLAIIILLILMSRRIFRRHRLGKAVSPPSSPGFQAPNSPFPERIARSINHISMRGEMDMGTGAAEGNGSFKWNEDVKEFGLGGRGLNEKSERYSAGSFFKDGDVEEKKSLMNKIGSLASIIKGNRYDAALLLIFGAPLKPYYHQIYIWESKSYSSGKGLSPEADFPSHSLSAFLKMKFSSLVQSVLLLAATSMALAPPRTHPKLMSSSSQADRRLSNKERAVAVRSEHFSKLNKKSRSRALLDDVDPNSTESDSNWSGATISPPTGRTFKSVTATMTLPKLTRPNEPTGPSDEYFLYVWVGIDGDRDCDALWQTGFAGQIENGVTSWWGWVCFIYGDEIVFDTNILDASTGDSVNMTVEALSSSSGIFWLDNLSTGETESYNVAGGDLCMQSAEWIVEDPYATDADGDILYFLVWPDFGTMTFDNAIAYTDEGTAIGPEDATLWYIDNYYSNITQNAVAVTDSTVSVAWVASGPAT
ncbi:hypothetical protein B7463_g10799, partial [Scytalidium lignicola]